jgi:hypothetical protein
MRCAEIIHDAEAGGWHASLFEYGTSYGGIGVMLPVRDGGLRESPRLDSEDAAKDWARGRGAVEFWT